MNSEKIVQRFAARDEAGMELMTPMVVSKEKKTLYLHLPKTGGSSIVRLLQNNEFDDYVLSDKRNSYETKLAYFRDVAAHWDEYYKFTFVRNKFDLLISLYNYDRQLNGPWSLDSSVSFEDFIRNHVRCVDTRVKRVQYHRFIDQYYLTHIDGEPLFDFIGHFNTYTEDLNKVSEHLGVENTQIHVNAGNYDRSKKDEYYTPELADILRAKFPEEFAHFGW
tara:strand:- start:3480 stop:4142 length:663 start_codon:yes stop_codon:yes gene_type:complete